MHRFYAPDIAATQQLPDDEAHHALRVMRLAPGTAIEVVDGQGQLYECRLDTRGALTILASRSVTPHWDAALTLAVAAPKNVERLEWLVEKAVEMGVTRIVPLLCARNERKTLRHDRLQRIAVSAMKQSLKATLPEIAELTRYTDFIAQMPIGQRFIGYCDANTERVEYVRALQPGVPATILIGPEGDFSPEEVKQARDAGCVAVTFGDTRLRTETAALYAVAAFHAINQRL